MTTITEAAVQDLAEKRMRHLGVKPPEPDAWDHDFRMREYEERRDTITRNARFHLEHVAEVEQAQADRVATADAQALKAQVSQLKSNYLAMPGATEADFAKALPQLLDELRRAAALTGNADALARAKASGRYSL